MTCHECERLKAELRVYRMREDLGLTPNDARILNTLYRAYPHVVPREALLNASRRQDHAKPPSQKLLDVYMCRIRDLTGRRGLRTVSGVGYALTAQGKADLDEMLA